MAITQTRMSCAKCKAEWWYTPGSMIHPMDHRRPDGRACSVAKAALLQTEQDRLNHKPAEQ